MLTRKNFFLLQICINSALGGCIATSPPPIFVPADPPLSGTTEPTGQPSNTSSGSSAASSTPTFIGPGTNFKDFPDTESGCGLFDTIVDSSNYVALNVYNTPGNYANNLPRPIPNASSSIMGMFQNGKNCGRWVSVTFADICTSSSSGVPNQAICPAPGVYVSDEYNGASLNMVVADSCTDNNAWGRDAPYHLDLHTLSLNNFSKNGQTMPNPTAISPPQYNNRKVTWSFIPAPNYTGDINIYFAHSAFANSNSSYLPIIITHLENGIHDVEVLVNGAWYKTNNNGDEGQVFVLSNNAGNVIPNSPYSIRIYDANDQLIKKTYTFSFPTNSCNPTCTAAYTQVNY